MDSSKVGFLFLLTVGALIILTLVIILTPLFINHLRPFRKMNRKELDRCYGIENQKNNQKKR